MEQENRSFTTRFDVRANAAGQSTLTGYAAVFNSLSVVLWGFREKIAPGAFTASLGDDVRALWNHNADWVLGRTTAGTLSLSEDRHGLAVNIIPPDSPVAQSFVESIRRGDVTQMSFGFRVLEDTWDEDENGQDIRTLLKVKLIEVSPCTFPAYPATAIAVEELKQRSIAGKARSKGASDRASRERRLRLANLR